MANVETIKELKDVRTILSEIYPDATKITVTIEGEKIKIVPNEEYIVPLEDEDLDDGE